MEYNTRHGVIKIFTDPNGIEAAAYSQIIQVANSPLGENAHIRIMPDVHAGAGCVIGTTMRITDKVCPNLVGVDIGCGVTLVKTDIDFGSRLEELDEVIREYVPSGTSVHDECVDYDFGDLLCWKELGKRTQELALRSLGTLGGGNHFIEAYADGYLCVHSGSRNIGLAVAKYYQKLTSDSMSLMNREKMRAALDKVPASERQEWLENHKNEAVPHELMYLTGAYMDAYLHDVAIIQRFANANRHTILETIVKRMGGKIVDEINSIHNYIDTKNMILRKGSISAEAGEKLVIPLNMRDGILICRGKGNEDWNCSAPHGAGRLYSRSATKATFTVEEYAESMAGIYTTCISESTLDEAPFAYKDYKQIMEHIKPTVDITKRIEPIYNFKA